MIESGALDMKGILDVQRRLFAEAFESKPGDYVALLDEDDERGPVKLCRADGSIVAVMTRDVYERLCDVGEAIREG